MSCILDVSYADRHGHYPTHRHPDADQLFFVRRGRVTVEIAGTRYEIDRPSVVFVGHNEPHEFTAKNFEYERYALRLDPALSRREITDAVLLSAFTDRHPNDCHVYDVRPIAERLSSLFSMLAEWSPDDEKRTPGGDIHLLTVLLELLYRTLPEAFTGYENSVCDAVGTIRRQIENDPATAEPLTVLAVRYHLSPCYLSHAFTSSVGESMRAYRTRCRIREAAKLLAETTATVSEISERVGYDDMSNFSRVFRKYTGATPTEYRRDPAKYSPKEGK